VHSVVGTGQIASFEQNGKILVNAAHVALQPVLL